MSQIAFDSSLLPRLRILFLRHQWSAHRLIIMKGMLRTTGAVQYASKVASASTSRNFLRCASSGSTSNLGGGPSQQTPPAGTGRTTHFGFKTVPEEQKETLGMCIVLESRSQLIAILLLSTPCFAHEPFTS